MGIQKWESISVPLDSEFPSTSLRLESESLRGGGGDGKL